MKLLADVPKVKRLRYTLTRFESILTGKQLWAVNQLNKGEKGWPTGYIFLATTLSHAYDIINGDMAPHEYALVLLRPERDGPVILIKGDADWIHAKLIYD